MSLKFIAYGQRGAPKGPRRTIDYSASGQGATGVHGRAAFKGESAPGCGSWFAIDRQMKGESALKMAGAITEEFDLLAAKCALRDSETLNFTRGEPFLSFVRTVQRLRFVQ